MSLVLPPNEGERLAALHHYQVLDTAPESDFDDLTALAAQICETPIALVSLVDAERQWFKSKIGLTVSETSREIAFCTHTILEDQVLMVPDALRDERFCHNPLVTAAPQIRFYAGAPLITPAGYTIGTLCVIDYVPRDLTTKQIQALQSLGRQVISQLELRSGLRMLAKEVSERKQAEEQIRAQSTLLDQSQDAICVLDTNDHIQFWNKSAEQLYGWTCEEVQGRAADSFLYEALAPYLSARQQVTQTGEWHGELHQVTKSGKELLVESRWTLVRDLAGQPKSILITNTDITDKKQFETQLLRSQRMESLGTLAGGIAHDLNNVLAPILMSIQLLQRKLPDAQSQQWLTILETSTRRGADLIKQVLSFARGIEGERVPLQVHDLIQEVLQIARGTFPPCINLVTEVPSELWTVAGDITQLHQVLINLCVNARDAMPDGGLLQITASNLWIDAAFARMHLDAKVGPYVMLSITDTGVGIPSKIIDRIFEPFFTTKVVGQGTGLGLATVLGIIKSHGGFVTVKSKVGVGTDFRVYLPAITVTAAPTVPETVVSHGQGELLLVVDDEPAVREITKTSLEAYDYQVMTAKDGVEAIALYAQHYPEIKAVIMDMMMPGIDGVTTTRTLQKINSQVKVLAVSGLTASDQLTEATSYGAKLFLSKPYTSQELLQTVDRLLHY